MFDYWEKVQSLKEEEVLEEIKKLHDKYFKLNERSPIRKQLRSMLDIAQTRYTDLQEFRRFDLQNEEKKNTVIDLGEVTSVEYIPDYTKDEILTHMAKFYYDSNGPIKQEVSNPAVQKEVEDTTQKRIDNQKAEQFTKAYKELIDDIPVFGKKDQEQ